jgi:hypothetical protein
MAKPDKIKVSRKDLAELNTRETMALAVETYRKLLTYIRPYRLRFIMGIGFSVLAGLSNFLLVQGLNIVFSVVLHGNATPDDAVRMEKFKLGVGSVKINPMDWVPQEWVGTDFITIMGCLIVPFVFMLRGSKELSDQDWMGRGFKLRAQSSDEVLQLLKQRQVDWVLLDTALIEDPPASVRALVSQALDQPTSGWSLRQESPVCKSREITGQLRLYQRATTDAVDSPATPSTRLPTPTS